MFRATGAQTLIWNNGIKSFVLLAMFPVFVAMVVYAGLVVTMGFAGLPVVEGLKRAFYELPRMIPWVLVGVGVWFVIAFFFNVHMIGLAMGAKTVTRREEPVLYNLLENLCISQGMPMPKLRIIETDALNAYASGLTRKQYTVAVTRGLMRSLEKEEIEAVLAHELAHIKHGDVRLMVIASVFVGIIALVVEMVFRNGDIFARAAASASSSKSSNKKGGGAGAIIVMVIIAIVVLLLARLLSVATQMAISRSREFMADMEATQMTRNPDAMVSALMKISGRSEIEDVPDDVRGMFFQNGRSFLGGLMSTHPPIDKRIASLQMYAGAVSGHDDEVRGPWANVRA